MEKEVTREELLQIAENWHVRSKKLAELFLFLPSNSEKKNKAGRLFSIMLNRLTYINKILTQPISDHGFKQSGYVGK